VVARGEFQELSGGDFLELKQVNRYLMSPPAAIVHMIGGRSI